MTEGMNITEASVELGFSSSNYFSSVFKRFTTQSPSDYLKGGF